MSKQVTKRDFKNALKEALDENPKPKKSHPKESLASIETSKSYYEAFKAAFQTTTKN